MRVPPMPGGGAAAVAAPRGAAATGIAAAAAPAPAMLAPPATAPAAAAAAAADAPCRLHGPPLPRRGHLPAAHQQHRSSTSRSSSLPAAPLPLRLAGLLSLLAGLRLRLPPAAAACALQGLRVEQLRRMLAPAVPAEALSALAAPSAPSALSAEGRCNCSAAQRVVQQVQLRTAVP